MKATDLRSGQRYLNPYNDRLAVVTAIDDCVGTVEYRYEGSRILRTMSKATFTKRFEGRTSAQAAEATQERENHGTG